MCACSDVGLCAWSGGVVRVHSARARAVGS